MHSRIRRLLRSVNTVFGRLAVLAISLLMLTEATWSVFVAHHQTNIEADHVSRILKLAIESGDTPSLRQHVIDALGFRFIDTPNRTSPPGCPAGCIDTNGDFEKRLRRYLPPESVVIADVGNTDVWVRYGTRPGWLIVPAQIPDAWRMIGANTATLLFAIFIALLGAWQIQRPLLRLARTARELRLGHHPTPVRVSGPSEVKELTRDFNEMMREISDADQERAIMLAGVAHDLRAPLTRIQVRATLVDDTPIQAGFLQDAASLTQIVTQFLDLARDSDEDPDAAWVEVDRFCQTRYAPEDEDDRDPLIQLHLGAGDGFTLPKIELDRILSNLIENAFSYGDAPLEIRTEARNGRYRLSVRDHGPGMPTEDFDRALRPFVRLDAARSGDAHCGLGLTIVRRLARRYGGELSLSNAPGGGLCVSLEFAARHRH